MATPRNISQSAQAKTQETIAQHVKTADVVITTAQVPGKTAPLLITAEMISQMRPGAVVVDLAAEQGGNCAYTEPGKSIDRHQVTIIGTLNLPASVPVHASQLYAKNITNLLQYLVKDGEMQLDFADDIVKQYLHHSRWRNLQSTHSGFGNWGEIFCCCLGYFSFSLSDVNRSIGTAADINYYCRS